MEDAWKMNGGWMIVRFFNLNLIGFDLMKVEDDYDDYN